MVVTEIDHNQKDGSASMKKSKFNLLRKVPSAMKLALGSNRKKKKKEVIRKEEKEPVVYSKNEEERSKSVKRYYVDVRFTSERLGLSLALVSQDEKLAFAITATSISCEFGDALSRGDELIAINGYPVPMNKTAETFDATLQNLQQRPLTLSFAVRSHCIGLICIAAAARDAKTSQVLANEAVATQDIGLANWYLSQAMASALHAYQEAMVANTHPACEERHVAATFVSAALAHLACHKAMLSLNRLQSTIKASARLATLLMTRPFSFSCSVDDEDIPTIAAYHGLQFHAECLDALRTGALIISETNPTTGLVHFEEHNTHDQKHQTLHLSRINFELQENLLSPASNTFDTISNDYNEFDDEIDDEFDAVRVWENPLNRPLLAPGCFYFETALAPDNRILAI
uniref:PDZ domain-containing protein n=1 Tax=Aureoumbra lagunensis TaxID=44058 RepID=A0A7S3JSJ6_9STRA|mmetsp:Transcript_7185/g.10703  ORF Transcript_7185/g.10703 Transcript_7185/m.10703 type:complete len:402 (+) Transcript_7185:32-1237(+)